VPKHRVEALVGAVARLIDVVCQPGKAPGEAGCDHVDLSGFSEEGAYASRQFTGVSDRGVGDYEQSLNRRVGIPRPMCARGRSHRPPSATAFVPMPR
jgi:hypothetical protein